ALDFQPDSPSKAAILKGLAFSPPDSLGEQAAYAQTEALQRLEAFEIASEPAFKASLDRFLDTCSDRELYIRLVAKFSVTDRYDELLAIARHHAQHQLAVDAIRALFDRQQTDLIRDALQSDDVVAVEEVLAALATAADPRSVELL